MMFSRGPLCIAILSHTCYQYVKLMFVVTEYTAITICQSVELRGCVTNDSYFKLHQGKTPSLEHWTSLLDL